MRYHVTGDPRGLEPSIRARKPDNVRFTGFLSAGEYVGQLQASDAVMALTTRDHTMQRGAYEAVYLGKPVVTSDFEVLRASFPKGTVHVRASSPEAIVRGLETLRCNLPRYRNEAEELRAEKFAHWDTVAARLLDQFQLPELVKPGEEDFGSACRNSQDRLQIAENR
ncbi:MAG: glycosyltransferase [Planctomycetaceae bacterium]